MALIPASVSEPFLYLLGVKNAIFCKFLDKLSALGIASEFSLRSRIDNFVPLVLFHEPASVQEITLTFPLRRNLGGTSA